MSIELTEGTIKVNGKFYCTVLTDIGGDIYATDFNQNVALSPYQHQVITDLLEKEQVKAEHIKESELQHERKLAVARASFGLTEVK